MVLERVTVIRSSGDGLLRDSRSSRLHRLLSRGSREVGSLLGCGRGGGLVAAEHLLDLAGVVTGVLLAHSRKLTGLLLGNAADLGGLGVDGVRGVLDMVVDELLVGSVDEGQEEGEGGPDDGKAPVGNELDEVVGDEGSDTSLQHVSTHENSTFTPPNAVKVGGHIQQRKQRRSRRRRYAGPQ
jgi:hypothetical protein